MAWPLAALFVSPACAALAAAAGMAAKALLIKLGSQEADDNLIVPLVTAAYLAKKFMGFASLLSGLDIRVKKFLRTINWLVAVSSLVYFESRKAKTRKNKI